MTEKRSIVLVTPADFALNRCVFLRNAPHSILTPGIKRVPAKILPITLPSTSLLFPCVNATEYKNTSTTDPKNALIAAPIPIDDCAEIEATAIPMKYARGIILSSAKVNIKAG